MYCSMYRGRAWNETMQAAKDRIEMLLHDAKAACASCVHFNIDCKGNKWVQAKEQGKKTVKCEFYEPKKPMNFTQRKIQINSK